MRNSSSLVEAIKVHDLSGRAMISLDVESLFASVYFMETVDFISNYLINNDIKNEIPVVKIKDVIHRCTLGV